MTDRSEQTTPGAHGTSELAATRPASIRAASAAEDLRAFFDALIDHQCKLTGGVAGAVFLLSGRSDNIGLFTKRLAPAGEASSDLRAAMGDSGVERALVRIARAACEGDGSLRGRAEPVAMIPTSGLYADGPTHRALAAPLYAEGRVQGASLTVLPGAIGDADHELRVVELINQRFETYLLSRHARAETEHKLMLRQTLELLDRAQQAPVAEDMASVLCDEFQQRFACTRASIGIVKGNQIRVVAISGSPWIDRRTPIVETLEAAMEECATQDVEIIYPSPPELESDPAQRRVTRRHELLFDGHGRSAILSLPLRLDGDLVGVAVLEREEHNPFPTGSIALVRLAAEFIGPALWTRRMADRGILSVARDQAGEFAEAAVGPRHTGWKILGVLAAAVVLALSAVPIPSRVVAAGELDAALKRSVTPPFNGFLDEVYVRPGDSVEQGQALAQIDATELKLRLAETQAQLAAHRTQRDDALTVSNQTDAMIAQARIDEVTSTIELLEDRIARATVHAPITGRIARGDLTAALGTRIETSQILFEVVGDETLVVLRIPERDIGRVAQGDTGWISTRAEPGERTPIEVVRINPVAEAGEGENAYRVEARLSEPERSSWLRPGMRVTARLSDGWTVPIAELARPIVDEARLRLWW